LHREKNVLYYVSCKRRRHRRNRIAAVPRARRQAGPEGPEVLLVRTEDPNKLTRPKRVKTRPVEYWKESATDQEVACGSDTESSLRPPALFGVAGGLSISGYPCSPVRLETVKVFKKLMWISLGISSGEL
jgi:hypothetical protein